MIRSESSHAPCIFKVVLVWFGFQPSRHPLRIGFVSQYSPVSKSANNVPSAVEVALRLNAAIVKARSHKYPSCSFLRLSSRATNRSMSAMRSSQSSQRSPMPTTPTLIHHSGTLHFAAEGLRSLSQRHPASAETLQSSNSGRTALRFALRAGLEESVKRRVERPSQDTA